MLTNIQGARIIVTGAAGFIGSRLLKAVEENGGQAVGLLGDVRDTRSFATEFDILLHCASAMPSDFKSNAEASWETNVAGVENAIVAAARNDADLVFASSSGVYGHLSSASGLCSEDRPPMPDSPYGESKLIGEELCRRAAEDGKIRLSVMRVFNAYGPRQSKEYLVGYLIDCARYGTAAKILSPADQRDLVHVDDIVDAFLAAAQTAPEFGLFNVGTGIAVSVRDIVNRFAKRCPVEIAVEFAEQPMSPSVSVADCRRIHEALGWRAKMDIDAGIEDVLRTIDI